MVIYLKHMWVKNTVAWLLPASWGYRKLMSVYVVCVFAVSLAMLTQEKVLCRFWDKFGQTLKGWFWQEANS